jgi:molybdopterin/thiamine biosynthesis adenylyltransferase
MDGKERYKRQVGLINILDYVDNQITIIGCGAIGSFTAISLCKMGFEKFELWDGDSVEEHNLPNQFFEERDIGRNKATATANYIDIFNSSSEVNVNPFFFKDASIQGQIVICSVDIMAARKSVFEACKRSKNVQLFIDTRMAGLQGQLYTIDMTNEEEVMFYEKTLFTDEQAVQERCTARAIIFTILGLVSLLCNNIVKVLQEDEYPNFVTIDYSVPQLM